MSIVFNYCCHLVLLLSYSTKEDFLRILPPPAPWMTKRPWVKATVNVFICVRRLSWVEAYGHPYSTEGILRTSCKYPSLLPLNRYHWVQNKQHVLNVAMETDFPQTAMNKSTLAKIVLFACLCLLANIDIQTIIIKFPVIGLWLHSGYCTSHVFMTRVHQVQLHWITNVMKHISHMFTF